MPILTKDRRRPELLHPLPLTLQWNSETVKEILCSRVIFFYFLGPTKLGPHEIRHFPVETSGSGVIISHVRVVIQPDGGISRFRLLGSLAWRIQVEFLYEFIHP